MTMKTETSSGAVHIWECTRTGCTTKLRSASPDLLERFKQLHEQKRHGASASR
ncbi:hypothetical protein ABZ502_17655 [Streptomyces abikoensis]|uniref:hypothetical protein n=1 Tax=Streptomyces abikoensis TaxID=97398 RepID=UPI0033F55AC0